MDQTQKELANPGELLLPRAIEAALRAGRVMKRLFASGLRADTKSGPHDLVTEADRRAEEYIIDCLQSRFPDHTLVGEESGTLGSGDPDSIHWLIDPLDGTMNFVRNIPIFAVSVAAMHRGIPYCGVVYNPIMDALFTAWRGGAVELNGKGLRVSDTAKVSDALLGIGLPHNPERRRREMAGAVNRAMQAGATFMRLGSAALNLAYVAAGNLDGFWELTYEPWDVAAGILMVQEAGGVVSNLDGSPLSDDKMGIVAANPALHGELVELLSQGPPE